MPPRRPAPTPQLIRSAVEIAVRLGAIALMVGWCLAIIAPFLGIVAWALIIAIAMDDPFEALCRRLGGRRVLTAVLCVGIGLVLIFGPAVLLSESLVSAAQQIAHELKGRELTLPPPNPSVRSIPIVGPIVFEGWQRASENLVETLSRLQPQLQAGSGWLLKTAGSVGAGILQLLASIVIAGVMLVRSEHCARPQSRASRIAWRGRCADPS